MGHPAAVWAAALAACSSTLFYYSRHLVPYDTSLLLLLGALYVGIKPSVGPVGLAAAGLLAFLGFFVYNGYWHGTAVVCLVLVAYRLDKTSRPLWQRGAWVTAGFVLVPVLLVAGAAALGQENYFSRLRTFQRFTFTYHHGDPELGWLVCWQYLWHAEHLLLPGLLLAAAFACRAGGAHRSAARTWLAAAGGIYAALVLLSTVTGKCPVYGRHVRLAVPLLCLAGACQLSELLGRAGRPAWARAALGGLLVVQACTSLGPHIVQPFPREFEARARALFGPMDVARTVQTWHELEAAKPGRPGHVAVGTSRPAHATSTMPAPSVPARHVLLNAELLLFPIGEPLPPPPGKILLRAPHPLQFRAHHFEDYTSEMSRTLSQTDISMRVVERQTPAP